MSRNAAVELMQLAPQYRTRFGHAVPMGYPQVDELPLEEQVRLVKEALANDKPVPGWDKMQGMTLVAKETGAASAPAPLSPESLKKAEAKYKAQGYGPAEIDLFQRVNRGEL